jgi:hypothetical protein
MNQPSNAPPGEKEAEAITRLANASPLPCKNNDERISWREQVQQWLPRLLGISPLLIMAWGIFSQGTPGMGLWMCILLIALCAALLAFYILIHKLTLNMYRGEGKKSRWLKSLMQPASPQANWLERFCKQAIGLLTSSPFPIEAIPLIYDYRLDQPDSKATARLNLIEDLKTMNLAIPVEATLKEEFMRNKKLWISSINNVPIANELVANEPKESKGAIQTIGVDGGVVEIHTNVPISAIYFRPDQHHLESSLPEHEDNENHGKVIEIPYSIGLKINEEGSNNRGAPEPTIQTDSAVIQIRVDSNTNSSAQNQTKKSLKGSINHTQQWIFKKTTVLMGRLSWLVNYVLKLRVQFLIFLLTFALFQGAGQVKDILLSMVLDQKPIHFWMACLTGVVLSVMLWHTSRQLTRLFPVIERRRQNRSSLSLQRQGIFSNEVELFLFWTAWISLALFTAPIAREAFEGQWVSFLIQPYILFALGALLIASWRMFDQPISTWTRPFQINFWLLVVLGALAPFLFGQLFTSASAIPNFMGSVALLFWALSLFLILGTTLYQFSIITSFPLLSLLIIAIYFINMNRVNDNHMVRLLSTGKPSPGQAIKNEEPNLSLTSLEGALATWLTQRRSEIEKFEKDSGQKYPIYVVSAQGGGIFAAYHSAKSLAVLSDQIPNFSDHLFAISGVSGGSIGSTVYANALRTQGRSTCGATKNLGDRIDEYFDNNSDRMATILSSLLFGDVTQRFFPLPVSAWDRSLGLELAFENGRVSANGNPIKLNAPFYETQDPRFNEIYTRPAAKTECEWRQAAPYLVLNTTEVSNGRRLILSAFRIPEALDSSTLPTGAVPPQKPRLTDADFFEPWLHRPKQGERRDMRFSTAAGLSARFPVVSPYGFFPEAFSRRFIDGGLYDNSGAITAHEIIETIRQIQDRYANSNASANANAKLQPDDSATPTNRLPAELATLSSVRDLLGKIVVYPIAIVDDKAVNLNSSYAALENQAKRQGFTWFGWTAIDAVLSTREARIQKAVDLLSRFDGKSPPRRVLLRKDFYLAGKAIPPFSVPLGWKLSCQARAFINDQIQPPLTLPPSSLPNKVPMQVPMNADGSPYSRLPCEKEGGAAQAIQRVPVDNANTPVGASSSRPFWWLIQQLKRDLDPGPSLTRGAKGRPG